MHSLPPQQHAFVTETSESSEARPASPPRRHDLDALRAFAMLLGVVLHAALAFAPVPWVVTNGDTAAMLRPMIELIHGFRMPLFFLMSGFFSAMLLQRRGVGGFLRHRWKRIGLPLLLGMITIIPLMWIVIIGGYAVTSTSPSEEPSTETLWQAAADGNVEHVQQLLASGAPVDQPDGRVFTLPLAWATTGDHSEVVAVLLEAGADPNQRMGDQNTPMHTAFFFGAADSVARMLEAGADLSLRNVHGETPLDSMNHERGTVDFIAALLDVRVDHERVETGRDKIAKLIENHTAPVAAEPSKSTLPPVLVGVLHGELFMHLWFLWHLCWLGAGLALVASALQRLPGVSIPTVLVATPLCLIALIPLTALTSSWQSNFGADTSSSLLPAPHVLVHYAVFFGFGALLHVVSSAADRLGRAWWIYLPVAALSGMVALRLTHDPAWLAGQGLDSETGRVIGLVLQSIFVWTVSLGLMGLARRLLVRPNRWVRYISDSSYWLYVAHLPFVIAGQLVLTQTTLPPLIEFALLTVTSTTLLLLSYHWLVRDRWIGRLLNGKGRSEPQPQS